MVNFNKLMMAAILAKDEKEFNEKADEYINEALKVLK